MKKLLIFGGTSEEHTLLMALAPYPLEITLCVASTYGQLVLNNHNPNLSVHVGRLTASEMKDLIIHEGFFCVIDATHPYATEVTRNIKAAATETGIKYLRLSRKKSTLTTALIVSTMQEAAALLNTSQGNVLLTTGSKELSTFTGVSDYQNRLYPRVLPTIESIKACLDHGFQAKNIIAMHGPFTKELNIALMRQFGIQTLVTKDGGAFGGLPEKLEAATELAAKIIVVARPSDDGLILDKIIAEITKLLEALK